MKLKETPWEKRNLGVNSSAVMVFEESDTLETLHRSVTENECYEYQEATVPMGRIDLLNALINQGFRFAEVAITTSMKPECVLPKAYQRRINDFSCHLADEDELCLIFDTIEREMIFQSDKISLNPRFGPEVASRRYGNWMKDEIRDINVCPYIITYCDKRLGFSIMKKRGNDVVDGLLSGLFNASRYSGLGIYLGYYTIEAARLMGAKVVKAHVSSNNLPVIKVNQLLGYQIEHMEYVLTKQC